MTHTAVVKFAPISTLDRLNDPAWTRPGRTLYDRSALRMLPGRETVPLVVDHDREIGTVNALYVTEWHDGPWLVASATVAEAPPWLARGTKASFEYSVIHRRDLTPLGSDADVVASGILNEVSVLSPGVRPAEPCAEVLLFERAELAKPSAVRPSNRRRVAAGSRARVHGLGRYSLTEQEIQKICALSQSGASFDRIMELVRENRR